LPISLDDVEPQFEITPDTWRRIVLVRQHLAPVSRGKSSRDIVRVIQDIGGLQHGWHLFELWNRFHQLRSQWFDEAYEAGLICEGHVLRTALRFVTCTDLPYYFQATRCVARRRSTYGTYPKQVTPAHHQVLDLLRRLGPLPSTGVREAIAEINPNLAGTSIRLLYELYNRGDVMRYGRVNGKPVYGVTELRQPPMKLTSIPEGEAQEWLFLKGLEAYGPLSVRDVAHWAGWTVGIARKTLARLAAKELVLPGRLTVSDDPVWARAEDIDHLEDYAGRCDVEPFVCMLFNDDALLLGVYHRLASLFGYPWVYPQFSRGEFLRPAILVGTELAGELDLDLRAKSPTLVVKWLKLRRKYQSPTIRRLIRERLEELAAFTDKQLDWDGRISN